MKNSVWSFNGPARQSAHSNYPVKKKNAGLVEPDSSGASPFFADNLREDLGFPVYLFDAWKNHYALKHAAILVLDENESLFLPAACVGFDSTTKRRIRIPREIIDQHSAFETKGFLTLTGDDRIIFEPFFSVREFGIFTKMDVIGIRHDETTYAILFAVWKEEEQEGPLWGYASLRPEYGAKLYSCYSAKLMGLLPPPYFDDLEQAVKSLEPALSRYREAGRQIHLCNVDLQTLLETVQPASASTDIFRFTEDVLRMLHSFVSPTGIFYRKSETEITLGFATTTAQDSQFLAHHLRLSISDFFPQTPLPDSTIYSWRSVQPDEIPDPPSALFA